MSKSLGNFFTIRDVLKMYHAMALRWFLISTHYRTGLNYTLRGLEEVIPPSLSPYFLSILSFSNALHLSALGVKFLCFVQASDRIYSLFQALIDADAAIAASHISGTLASVNQTMGAMGKPVSYMYSIYPSSLAFMTFLFMC